MDKPGFESSVGDIQNFMKSAIWRDMKREVFAYLAGESEDLAEENSRRLIFRRQGAIKALKWFLGLPDEIIVELSTPKGTEVKEDASTKS